MSKRKTSKWAVIRVSRWRMKLPLYPIPEKRSLSERVISRMKTTGVRSLPFNLEKAANVSEYFFKRFRAGDDQAVFDLLEVDQAFIHEPWVGKAIWNLYKAGKLFKPKRGRRRGREEETKLVGVVLVGLVDELARRTGKHNEQIFGDLAARRFEDLSLDRIKDLYYQTKRELPPCLFFLDEQRFVVPREEAERLKVQLEEKAMGIEELRGSVDLSVLGLGTADVRFRKK